MLKNTDKNPRALKTHRWDRAKTVGLVTCAMLTALGVVLGGLLSIPAMPLGSYSLKIGFGALPVIVVRALLWRNSWRAYGFHSGHDIP